MNEYTKENFDALLKALRKTLSALRAERKLYEEILARFLKMKRGKSVKKILDNLEKEAEQAILQAEGEPHYKEQANGLAKTQNEIK